MLASSSWSSLPLPSHPAPSLVMSGGAQAPASLSPLVTHPLRVLDRMGDWNMPIGLLGEEVVAQLCELLDNASRGWRKLAELAGVEKRFKCR